jgi:hypothetical protein
MAPNMSRRCLRWVSSGHFGIAEQCALYPMCGRLRVGKDNLHVAGLVGAPMCSACLRGSHDRWP